MSKKEKIRWSIYGASMEFPIDRRTLEKNLIAQDAKPDAKKTYSTPQICRAVFGDMDGEKLRLTREQADKHWLDNQRTRESLVEREKVAKFLEKTFTAVRQKVISSGLTREEQDEVLLDLKALKNSPWVKDIDEPLAT